MPNQTWELTTENLRRFGFSALPENRNLSLPRQLVIDGQVFSFATPFPVLPSAHFCNLNGTAWVVCSGEEWTTMERNPKNYGPVRQVLEGPVAIVYGSQSDEELHRSAAVWLANDLYHTGRFSIQIFRDTELDPEVAARSNLILMGTPTENLWSMKLEPTFPLKFVEGGFRVGLRSFTAPGTGAIFLANWAPQDSRVAVVVAGTDAEGFWRAFQAFPTHTGHMVPDYLVVGKTFGWAGAGGVLAAGYWDNQWKFDYASGYLK